MTWTVTQDFADQLNSGEVRVAHSDKGHFGRSESLKCAELGKKVSEGLVEGLKTEDALKLIDSLMVTNGTFRREIIMSDAIMSIRKEA